MIETAHIKNFRHFENVRLSGFKRINLVVGDNMAGKTALLEALFCASANGADVTTRLRAWRGYTTGFSDPLSAYDGLFLHVFPNFDKGKLIEIDLKGSGDDSRSLRLYFGADSPLLLPFDDTGTSPSEGAIYNKIYFEWTDQFGNISVIFPEIQSAGQIVYKTEGAGNFRKTNSSFLASRQPFNHRETAEWYSNWISQKNKEMTFLRVVKSQFEDVKDISIESEGGVPVLFASLKYKKRKYPIGYISDGFVKLMTLFVHIAHAEGTATFIDEMENGIHFSRHEKLWEQLVHLTGQYNSQLFASTHSFEFLESLVPTLKKHPKLFSLTRVHRERQIGVAKTFSGEDMLSLIEGGLEIRG